MAEICEIMASCRKNGVVNLEIPGLKLDFTVLDQMGSPKPPKLTKKQAALAKANEKRALEDGEFKTRMEQLQYLRLADPLAYEDLISRGELEHAGEESERADIS